MKTVQVTSATEFATEQYHHFSRQQSSLRNQSLWLSGTVLASLFALVSNRSAVDDVIWDALFHVINGISILQAFICLYISILGAHRSVTWKFLSQKSEASEYWKYFCAENGDVNLKFLSINWLIANFMCLSLPPLLFFLTSAYFLYSDGKINISTYITGVALIYVFLHGMAIIKRWYWPFNIGRNRPDA